jgi:hypothetical protein
LSNGERGHAEREAASEQAGNLFAMDVHDKSPLLAIDGEYISAHVVNFS